MTFDEFRQAQCVVSHKAYLNPLPPQYKSGWEKVYEEWVIKGMPPLEKNFEGYNPFIKKNNTVPSKPKPPMKILNAA